MNHSYADLTAAIKYLEDKREKLVAEEPDDRGMSESAFQVEYEAFRKRVDHTSADIARLKKRRDHLLEDMLR